MFFIKRDNEYYDFKPEIESKEQIREYLETKEQSIINQFEHWWDKYQVSLNEIDTQVKQSEKVMWDYLKELGYGEAVPESWTKSAWANSLKRRGTTYVASELSNKERYPLTST